MSTPMTFTVTHITDQVTNNGKTKVLLNCDAVDKTITLSTLLDLSLFPATSLHGELQKFHRLTTDNYKFEDVETDYFNEETGMLVMLKKPRQTVWLNGNIRRQKSAPIAPTTVTDLPDDDAPTTEDAF